MSNLLEQIEEIQKNIRGIKGTWGNTIMTLDNIKSGLKSDVQKKVDEAYQKGYKDCETRYCSFDACPNRQAEYQRGLNDAWEAAKKIVTWPDRSLVNSNTFDLDPGESIFTKYSASEAVAKLKAYEEKQNDKIEVGDEVEWDNDFTGDRFIVTRIYQPYGKKEQCDGIDDDGDVYRAVLIESLVKTGRHFDIASILEDMRNE